MTTVRQYRKICQEYYGYTDAEMLGKDVHHKDRNRKNNSPENLILLSPEEHAKIHESEFILYARIGSKLGNEALRNRLHTLGPTEKEILNWKRLGEMAKVGQHITEHSEETKQIISENKKLLYKDKSKHPMWGFTKYEVSSPEGEIFIISEGWKEWCSARGLNPANLRKVALGERLQHKGWKAKICPK